MTASMRGARVPLCGECCHGMVQSACGRARGEPAVDDEGLREPVPALAYDGRAREQLFELTPAHQADLAHQLTRGCGIAAGPAPADGAPTDDRDAESQREPVPGREQEVRFHREPEVRRLHP